MANELRIYQDLLAGRVSDNPLGSGSTTINSPAFAAMTAVDSTQHMMLVLDPDGLVGAPEIVKVTAHTAVTTSCTVVRAQFGTTARLHAQGTDWVHGPLSDWAGAVQKGAGTPEAVVTAPVGTLYIRTDGGTSTTLYVKETGSGNTGWVAK